MSEETYTQKVRVEVKEAVENLARLREAIQTARKARREALKGGDGEGARQFGQQLKALNAEVKQHERAMAMAEIAGKDLARTSQDTLAKTHRWLREHIRYMDRGTDEYKQAAAELTRVNEALREAKFESTHFNKAYSTGSGLLGRLAERARGVGGALLEAFGRPLSLGGMVATLGRATAAFKAYEERLAGLSSLTGISGEQLQGLGQTAKEMSKGMGASAGEILDAFQLMGSAKPELLANEAALVDTTRAALTLADAAKMDVGAAVSSLAATMNQFGADAGQAERYINALAAGSKAGAASVDDISRSITKFGAQAASAGVPVEESIALIEALAEKGIKGEEAGTALKGVLLKLQTGAEEFNPKVHGMAGALENLAKANLSVKEKVKMFGESNIVAADILISGRAAVEGYAAAVTGTRTALEQATTNTDTLNDRMARLKNTVNVALIDLGEAIAPVVLDFLDGIAAWERKLRPFFDFGIRGLKGLLGGIRNLLSPLRVVGEGFGDLLGKAMELAGVAGSARGALDEMNAAVVKQTVALGGLIDKAKHAAKGSGERRDAIALLNQQYGSYLPHLLSEKSSLREIEEAQRLATRAIEHNMLAKAKRQELERIETAGLKKQVEALVGIREAYQEFWGADTAGNMRRVQELAGMEDKAAFDRAMKDFIAKDNARRGAAKRAFNHSADKVRFYKLVQRLRAVGQEAAEEKRAAQEVYEALEKRTPKPKEYRKRPVPASPPVVDVAKPAVAKPKPTLNKEKVASPKRVARAGEGHDHELAALERALAKKRGAVAKAYRELHRDKAKYERELEEVELAGLTHKHSLLERRKRELEKRAHRGDMQARRARQKEIDRYEGRLSQIEARQRAILDRRVARAEAKKLAAHRRVLDAKVKAERLASRKIAEAQAAQLAKEKAAAAERTRVTQQYLGVLQHFGNSAVGIFSSFQSDSERSGKAFQKQMINLALDSLHDVVKIAIGQIWAGSMASADSIASFGASGAIKAGALTAVVEGAYQVAKGAVARNLHSGRLAPGGVEPRGGLFEVVGEEDGQHYTVPYGGVVEDVRWVANPTLISELGGEIVIDHGRSQNIVARYPQILDAIRAVPQHAGGTVPDAPLGSGGGGEGGRLRSASPEVVLPPELGRTLSELQRLLEQLDGELRRGIAAHVSVKDLSRHGFVNRNDGKWGVK